MISYEVLWECEASSHRFHSARHVLCQRCEQSVPRRIHRNLRLRALRLRASQLASVTRGNNNRSDRRRKIGEEVVHFSRGQARQELSNRFRSEPNWREAKRGRHENSGRNLQDR